MELSKRWEEAVTECASESVEMETGTSATSCQVAGALRSDSSRGSRGAMRRYFGRSSVRYVHLP